MMENLVELPFASQSAMPEVEEKRPESEEKKPEKKEEPLTLVSNLAELAIKALKPGGVTVGGGYGLWLLLIEHKSGAAITSALIGFCASYAGKLFESVHEGNQRRLGKAGKAIDQAIDGGIDQLFAKVTGAEAKYLEAQKLACQTDRCQGFMQSSVPLLEEIIVSLSISSTATYPGWQEESAVMATPGSPDQTIWPLLRQAEKTESAQMAILAWGGYGKTTLLKHITYIYSSKQYDRDQISVPARTPILIALGDCWKKYLAEKDKLVGRDDLPDLAITITEYHIPSLPSDQTLRMPSNWAEDKLKTGKAIVLLDGLDEVPQDKRATVSRWIDRQVSKYRKAIFIVTSRPKAYQEQAKANRLSLRSTLWVEPLDVKRRRQFLEKWFLYQERYANNGRDGADVTQYAQESANALIDQIESNNDLRDLAKIPLLLNMIATFYRSAGKPKLPKRRVDLYQKICNLQLKDRPEAKELETLLVNTDVQEILQMLALEMLLNNREKSLDREMLLTCLTKYLQEENETAEAKTFLDDVVRISELLIEKDADSYEFAHWSFQEYLAAKQILATNQECLLHDRFNDLEWKPTILLYAAQLKNPVSLLQTMLNKGASDLAYECFLEITKQIDAGVENQLQGLNYPVVGATATNTIINSNYLELRPTIMASKSMATIEQVIIISRHSKLKELLKDKNWEAADQETYRLMITSVGKEEGQRFSSDNFENFPCAELRAIDQLWVSASHGYFGFSVQKKIWEDCLGSTASIDTYDFHALRDFEERVGWEDGEGEWELSYPVLQKKTRSGHLPGLFWHSLDTIPDTILVFSRIMTCGL
jgi:GUN4-like/NACHT domain